MFIYMLWISLKPIDLCRQSLLVVQLVYIHYILLIFEL